MEQDGNLTEHSKAVKGYTALDSFFSCNRGKVASNTVNRMTIAHLWYNDCWKNLYMM